MAITIRFTWLLAIVLLCGLATSRAYAQSDDASVTGERASPVKRPKVDCSAWTVQAPAKAPRRAQRKRARRAARAAKRRCRRGQHRRCADGYQQAYTLAGRSKYLRLLGQAYQQAGERVGAICAYQQFVSTESNIDRIAEVDALVMELLTEHQRAQASSADVDAVVEPAPVEPAATEPAPAEPAPAAVSQREHEARDVTEPVPALDEVGPRASVADQISASDVSPSERLISRSIDIPSPRGATMRHAGTAMVGVGGIAVGLGVLHGLKARRASDALSTDRPWSQHFDDLIREGESDSLKAVVFTTVGGAAMIAGGVLYYLGHVDSRSIDVQVHAGASDASVTITGSF